MLLFVRKQGKLEELVKMKDKKIKGLRPAYLSNIFSFAIAVNAHTTWCNYVLEKPSSFEKTTPFRKN